MKRTQRKDALRNIFRQFISFLSILIVIALGVGIFLACRNGALAMRDKGNAFYKETAYRETFRVLKKDGIFCGCFYIRDELKRTDFFVKHMYVPKGFFTPPFESKESLQERLESMYHDVRVHSVNAEGIFCCRK